MLLYTQEKPLRFLTLLLNDFRWGLLVLHQHNVSWVAQLTRQFRQTPTGNANKVEVL